MRRAFAATFCRLSAVGAPAYQVRFSSDTTARLSSMSTDELMSRAMGYSKQFIPQDQRQGVRALLQEVLQSRVGVLTVKGFRDILSLANLSQNHLLCVEIFRKRSLTHGSDAKFTVYDVVVESAYRGGDVAVLEEIAGVCSRKLRTAPREVIADFALARTLWRAICILCDPETQESVQREAKAAVGRIWENCIVPAVPGVTSRVTLKEILQEARRQMLYASPEEKGEMAFFLLCKQRGVLKNSNRPLHELRSNETYYCALIRTCRNGCFSDVAMDYFEELRSASTATMMRKVGNTTGDIGGQSDQDAPAGLDAAESTSEHERALFESLGLDASVGSPRSFHDDSSAGGTEVSTSGAEGTGMTEVVIFTVVSVLHAARDNQRIVDMGKSLIADASNTLSASILATLGSAGGEIKDLAFVKVCYDGIVKSQMDAPKPNTFLVYSALSSLSKCSVADFKPTYLDVCIERGLVNNDPETHTYLIIQNAMGSVNPMAAISPLVSSALEDESFAQSLSVRVASLLFKVLLRSESEEFLPLYKRLVECGLFKQVWVEELILWADRRRYFLSQSDRNYIVSEIKRHYRIGDLKSANLHGLEKLRTHVAGIHHDAQFNPLERFRNEQWISPEPTVLDSRVHFILKRKTCIEGNPHEQLKRFVDNNPGVRTQHMQMAEAALASAQSSPDQVTDDEFRFGLLDLLARKQLETI